MKLLLTAVTLTLALSSAYGAETMLLCDNDQDRRQIIRITSEGDSAALDFLNGDSEFSGSVVRIETTLAKVRPLLAGKLAMMNLVVLKDRKFSASFRIDGRDVYQHARLGVVLSGPRDLEMKLSNCIGRRAARAGI